MILPIVFQLRGTQDSLLLQVQTHPPQLVPSSTCVKQRKEQFKTPSQIWLVDTYWQCYFSSLTLHYMRWGSVYSFSLTVILYLHFLPNALAAEVLGFVEVVCSKATC